MSTDLISGAGFGVWRGGVHRIQRQTVCSCGMRREMVFASLSRFDRWLRFSNKCIASFLVAR